MDQGSAFDDTSPSSRLRRPHGGWSHVGHTLKVVARVVFYLTMGVLLVLTAALGVGGTLSAGEPIIWGTFTEERCEPSRYGCRSVGTWVSDDGTIRMSEVALDGRPGSNGVVPASYRPNGFNNDSQNNIVHVESWTSGFVWFPWVLFAVFVWIVVVQSRRWLRA